MNITAVCLGFIASKPKQLHSAKQHGDGGGGGGGGGGGLLGVECLMNQISLPIQMVKHISEGYLLIWMCFCDL